MPQITIARYASIPCEKPQISGQGDDMAKDIAKELETVSTGSSGPSLSADAIMSLLIEIQASLVESADHAHMADTAEDLLFGLALSIKNGHAAEAVAGSRHSGKSPSCSRTGPQLRLVENQRPTQGML